MLQSTKKNQQPRTNHLDAESKDMETNMTTDLDISSVLKDEFSTECFETNLSTNQEVIALIEWCL